MPFVKKIPLPIVIAAALAVFLLVLNLGIFTAVNGASASAEETGAPESSEAPDGGDPAVEVYAPPQPEAATLMNSSPDEPENEEPSEAGGEDGGAETEDDGGGTEIITAMTVRPANFYRSPMNGVIKVFDEGQELKLAATDSVLWYLTVENGVCGYIYAGNCVSVSGGKASDTSLLKEGFDDRVSYLRKLLPNGKYWNHVGMTDIEYGEETPWIVTDTPCRHAYDGQAYCNFYNGASVAAFRYDSLCECLGFASLLSDSLFGTDAPIHSFKEPERLRLGDHIRFNAYDHSMIVTAIDDKGVTVAECNSSYEDCLICWTTRLTWEHLKEREWDSEYLTRYPTNFDGTFWED